MTPCMSIKENVEDKTENGLQGKWYRLYPPPPDEDKSAPNKSRSIQSTKDSTPIKLNHEDDVK